MGIKIVAKASLEFERAKKKEKDRLPERIVEVEGISLQQMLATAEVHENALRLEQENKELKQQVADQSMEFMLAIAELYEMQSEKEG